MLNGVARLDETFLSYFLVGNRRFHMTNLLFFRANGRFQKCFLGCHADVTIKRIYSTPS